MIYGLTFNGKHSFEDFGLYIEKKTINPPAKTKILEAVPFMNSKYDFSTIGSGGEQVFDTRTIIVKLALLCYSMEELYTIYSQVLEWLTDCGQSQLIFDFDQAYYYLADVQEASKFEDFAENGELEVTFIAEPFRYSVDYMGDDIWDNFNFLTDYTQYTNEFDITETGPGTAVIMYNNGRLVKPVINVDVDGMRVNYNNNIYYLNKGDNKLWDLKLENGRNILHFYNALGKVKIIFRCEVL